MAIFSKNMGPSVLIYDGTDIGETHGGVSFKYTMATNMSTADKTGDTARQKIISGISCTIEAALTEPSLLQLSVIAFGSEYTGSAKLQLQAPVGKDLVEEAKILIIKPIVDGAASATQEDWIYIPKASVVPNFDVPHTYENQKIWAITFEGHPVVDLDIASGERLDGTTYEVGDVAVLGFYSV